jgi:multidrug resistance efflux pump
MSTTPSIATAAELLESAEYFGVVSVLAPESRVRVQVASLEAERQQLERDAKRFDAMAAEEAGRRETLDGRRARTIDECEQSAEICRQIAARIAARVAKLTGTDAELRECALTIEQLHAARASWALHEMAAARAGI